MKQLVNILVHALLAMLLMAMIPIGILLLIGFALVDVIVRLMDRGGGAKPDRRLRR